MRVLVDANVVRKAFACISEPHAIKTLRWGKSERVNIVMRASHTAALSSQWEAEEILFVPPLFEAAQNGRLTLLTSDFLQFEMQNSQSLRNDSSAYLFDLPRLECVKDPSFSIALDMSSPILQRANLRVPAELTEVHETILSTIGGEKTSDAAHILTAHYHKVPYLPTLDRKLRNSSQRLSEKGIATSVVLPGQLAKHIHIKPSTDSEFRQRLEGASIFRAQRMVPFAERKRVGPLGLLATPYKGVGEFTEMTDTEIRSALKVLRQQVLGRKILRHLPLSLLWSHGNPDQMRQLIKARRIPIRLS